MALHSYEVKSVAAGCTAYYVGQIVERNEPEPPPQTIKITGQGVCNGTELELVE